MSLKFSLKDELAIIPIKANVNEVGYDLTIISKEKQINSNCILYDTGVVVEPPEGFYTEIVPRSSIIKTGWMLANNVGIIDPTYRGTLKIAMVKVCPEAVELELPFKKFQLIVRKMYNFDVNVVSELSTTYRGDGGFGSTDNEEYTLWQCVDCGAVNTTKTHPADCSKCFALRCIGTDIKRFDD